LHDEALAAAQPMQQTLTLVRQLSQCKTSQQFTTAVGP